LLVLVLALVSTVAIARGGGGHGGGSHGSEGGHESSGWHEEEPQPPGRPTLGSYGGHAGYASHTEETGGDSFWHNVVLALLAGLSAVVIVMISTRYLL
jgi:hypothetical protein